MKTYTITITETVGKGVKTRVLNRLTRAIPDSQTWILAKKLHDCADELIGEIVAPRYAREDDERG